MTLTADEIVDRRRTRRRLTFWRIVALLLLAIAVAALMSAAGMFNSLGKTGSDHIARVEISGVITDDRPMLDLLEELGKKDQVKAVILDISSPGGSTVGGEAHFEAIRKLAEKKPVVASVGTLAASAGYMIAAASDHIVAHKTSIVGSIGVFVQYATADRLLEKIGVEVGMVKSSPLKAEPSPFSPVTEEEKAMIRNLVMDTYDWFVGLVADRRKLDPARARALADGSIFTGRQSLENGLVDELGDVETARKWLVAEKGISTKLEVLQWTPKRQTANLFGTGSVAGTGLVWLAEKFGVRLNNREAEELREFVRKRLFLDGLQSILQN